MGKITFYCTICAGPLYEWELRKLSTAQEGDDPNLCFEDGCDCDYESNSDDGEEDSGEDGSKHDDYCQYNQGYWGDILPARDIAWLATPRMLRMRTGDDEDEIQVPDDGSPCYLTEIGEYDPYEGLQIPSLSRGLWANQDGFLVHDTCWKMLQLVHSTVKRTQQPLDPRHIYLAMLSKLTHDMDEYIYWGDDRLYGGTEKFAEQEWQPWPGYEWLVADPSKEMDFSELIGQSIGLHPGTLNGHARTDTPGSISVDPFSSLPTEVHHMILQLLPSPSVLNLFLSSRVFRGASTNLPQGFWRSRIHIDTPWVEGTSLYEDIERQGERLNYKVLLQLLKTAGARPPDGKNSRQEHYLSLKNRRRIWTCCEAILDITGLSKDESGSVSSEMEALTNTRIARIYQSETGEIPNLVNCETYFCPTTLDPPTLRGVTVYLSPQASIVGIEWSLEGETSGRLFGNRATAMQSVALPPNLAISGILLSLGSSPIWNGSVWGFGILSEDSPIEPRIKLGRWSEEDLVHVFRPAISQPNTTIVGIAGEYTESQIVKFGILTADIQEKTPRTVAPAATNIDIYTRWFYSQFPHPGGTLQIRHGIKGFPLRGISPLNPPLLEHPGIYLDLKNRQITSVEAFFPLGRQKEFGGFRFRFADGSEQLVGSENNHESVARGQSVAFDPSKQEEITKIICYFDSNPDRTTPSRLHGLEFCTNKNRKLGLGWLDAWSEDYRRDSYVRRGERVVGLHFGIGIPVIESIGLVVA